MEGRGRSGQVARIPNRAAHMRSYRLLTNKVVPKTKFPLFLYWASYCMRCLHVGRNAVLDFKYVSIAFDGNRFSGRGVFNFFFVALRTDGFSSTAMWMAPQVSNPIYSEIEWPGVCESHHAKAPNSFHRGSNNTMPDAWAGRLFHVVLWCWC